MGKLLDFFNYQLLGRIKRINEAKTRDELIKEIMLLRKQKRAELVYKHFHNQNDN